MSNGEKKNFLSGMNLPEIFGGRAGDALSRLVGVPINTVAARLERGEANIVARTEGQVEFQRIMANAAAQEAIKNPEFMKRAMENFGGDIVRKQINKDEVAKLVVQNLDDSADSKESANASDKVDSDWLNNFSSYAENASSEDLRKRLAGILSGEIKKPGTFSFSAVRFISELNKTNAELIRKILNHNFGGGLVYSKNGLNKNKVSNVELVKLQGLGLIGGTGGLFNKKLNFGQHPQLGKNKAVWPLNRVDTFMLVTANPGHELVQFTSYPLTELGLEIQELFGVMEQAEFTKHIQAESEGVIASIELITIVDLNILLQGTG